MEVHRCIWVFHVLFIICMLQCSSATSSEVLSKPGGCPRRILPPDRCVSNQTDECSQDADCSGVAKCCSTGCANFCVMPVYTACEQQVEFALRRSRSLGPAAAARVRLPVCDQFGEFQPVQCDRHQARCWCVDKNGFERAGTRARSLELINCSRQHECAAQTCRMLCPYNFRLDEYGCPLCQCWDPCQGVECPGQLSCQLEEVPCANEPCPPVPTCKQARSLESLCAAGRPLTFAQGSRPFICGTDPGKPECPALHECTVPQGAEYGVCCPSVKKALAPAERCPASLPGQREQCGVPCQFDFQCAKYDSCCSSEVCGTHCMATTNMTKCQQKRKLAEVMIVKEKDGKGYIPQCRPDGSFERRQCSRNGLVCWCVGEDGHNLRGTMGPADQVVCHSEDANRIQGRALQCMPLRCGDVCPFGFQRDEAGCPSCRCARPCDGYPCTEGTICVAHNTPGCLGPVCQSTPKCIPVIDASTARHHITPPEPSAELEMAAADPHAEDLGVPYSEDDAESEEKSANPLKTKPIYTDEVNDDDVEAEVDGSVEDEGFSVFDTGARVETETGVKSEALVLDGPHLTEDSVPSESRESYLVLGADPEEVLPLEGGWLVHREVKSSAEGTADALEGSGVAVHETPAESLQFQSRLATAESVVDSLFNLLHGRRPKQLGGEDAVPPEGVAGRAAVVEESTDGYQGDYNGEEVFIGTIGENDEDANLENDDLYAVQPSAQTEGVKAEKPGQCPFSAPVGAATCDFECGDDSNCSDDAKCCSTGCGMQCTQPILATACQHQKHVLEDRARSLGIPLGRTFIPHCRDQDGGFSPLQCHPVLGVCWCVDESGRELPATRAAGRHNARCSSQNSTMSVGGSPVCPELECPVMDCAHGQQLDANGCATCSCADLCADTSCPDGLQCRPVQLRCITRPCPPLPLCLPPLENPCPQGTPLGQAACGVDQPACPTTHQCHISPFREYHACCPKPRDVCQLPVEAGRCDGQKLRWYFDRDSASCRQFSYSGCGGNANSFSTPEECNTVCPVLSPCQQLREKNALIARVYRRVAFLPQCDPDTGAWQSVQCQPEFGLCWCVQSNGTRVPGTLTADGTPNCSNRRGRRINLHRRTRICSLGQTVHVCERSLCDDKVCLSHPEASCRIDPCGGCRHRFYDDDNREVNCTRDLTPCQLEEQEVLNSAAWQIHGRYEQRDRSSARLYAALKGILSQRDSSDTDHKGELDETRRRPGSLLADGIPASPPRCDSRGRYRPEQGVGGFMWCVDPQGAPQHHSLTHGIVKCDRNGNLLRRQSLGPVCPSGVEARVCSDQCVRAACPGHRDAICVADPCNNCQVSFYSVSGRPVECSDKCSQPVASGRCRGSLPRVFYDSQLGRCLPFLYGGCGGNNNNFRTMEQCQSSCQKPEDVCSLQPSAGPCNGSETRWFYNPAVERCQTFPFGGCGGNNNNFRSQMACQSRCPDLVMCPSAPDAAAPCSRGKVCSAATCAARPDALCRVEACSCHAYFVDVNGERVNCQTASINGVLTSEEVVVVNALVPESLSKKARTSDAESAEDGVTPAGEAMTTTTTSSVEDDEAAEEGLEELEESSTVELTPPPSPAPAPYTERQPEPTPDEATNEIPDDEVVHVEASVSKKPSESQKPSSSKSSGKWVTLDLSRAALTSKPLKSKKVKSSDSKTKSSPPSTVDTAEETLEGSESRQARFLHHWLDGEVPSELRTAGGRFGGGLSAAEPRGYVALQREVVARRGARFPFSAAVVVICALGVTVVAAAVVGGVVYRRRSSDSGVESERTRPTIAVPSSGRSLHEQLSQHGTPQQSSTFRWNF